VTGTREERPAVVRRRVMRALLMGLLALIPVVAEAQFRVAATLLAVQGLTQVRRSGTAADLAGYRNMRLGGGDLVRTRERAKASILCVDGSFLTLNQNTAILIPQLASRQLPNRIGVTAGEVFARIVHGRHIRFETTTTVAGVHGTELDLRVDPDSAVTLTV